MEKGFTGTEDQESKINEYCTIAFLSDPTRLVDCKIIENNKTIFSVRILASSREQAKFICDNWKENATSLYPNLLNILTKTKT